MNNIIIGYQITVDNMEIMVFAKLYSTTSFILESLFTIVKRPKSMIESYSFDMYTCIWIRIKSRNRWNYQKHEHPPDASDLWSEVVDDIPHLPL